MELEQQSQRLKALWKSGRNKYQSFFVVLREVRNEIGDERLAAWCFKMGIGFSAINKAAGLLTRIEEDNEKIFLRAARQEDIDQKRKASFERRLETIRRKTQLEQARAVLFAIKEEQRSVRFQQRLAKAVEKRQLAEERMETARANAERKALKNAPRYCNKESKNEHGLS